MIITAKFASTCPCCSKPIHAGDRVVWAKSSKARHVACTPPATTSASSGDARRRVYRRCYGWDGREGSSSYYMSGLYDVES